MTLITLIYFGAASVYWQPQSLSNGEQLNVNALTIAHPKATKGGEFAFGTCWRVRYREREAVTSLKDNGPHVKDRILDMTPAVAKALAFPGLGVVAFWKVPCGK